MSVASTERIVGFTEIKGKILISSPELNASILNSGKLSFGRNLRKKLTNLYGRVVTPAKVFDSWATLSLTILTFSAYGVDRMDPNTPGFLQGRIVDIIGTTANAALDSLILGDGTSGMKESFQGTRFEDLATKAETVMRNCRYIYPSVGAFSGQVFWEVLQKYGIMPGTYDSGDIVAYGIGALGWAGLNYGAEYLSNRLLARVLLR